MSFKNETKSKFFDFKKDYMKLITIKRSFKVEHKNGNKRMEKKRVRERKKEGKKEKRKKERKIVA